MEECAMCSEPVYTAERITIQNIPLHHTCFCCVYCGKKLSLLNYATFCGAFYCKVHYKLLAVAKERSQGEIASIHQKHQQLQITMPPVLALESKNRSNRMGRVLIQEKTQPRLSGLHPRVSPKAPKQARQLSSEKASQNQLARTSWLPLKEAVEDDPDRKHYRSKTTEKLLQDPILSLQRQSRADGKPHKVLEDKLLAETAQPEKKQNQFTRLTFPKEGKHASHWMKTVGANGDLGVLEKRLSLMDKSIPGALARKQGSSISEKAVILQHNSLKGKRPVPVVSPLRSIPPKPSPVASWPSHSGALRNEKVTHLASTGVPVFDPPNLAKVPFAGKKLSRSSSSKGASDGRNDNQILGTTELLPRARVKLPALAPPDSTQRKKLPETTKRHRLITLALEETKLLSHISLEQMEGPKPTKTKPEAVVYLPEKKEEKGSETKHDSITSADYLDSVATCQTTKQGCELLWADRNDFPGEQRPVGYPASLWGPSENQLYLESPSGEVEVKKKEEMQHGRISGSFDTLDCVSDQASQETKPVEAEVKGSLSVSSLQADDPENMDIPPRNNPQDAILTCNGTLSIHETPEASVSPVKTAHTVEELPRNASSENNILLKPQDYISGMTILQASSPQVKEPEAPNSCEISCWTENQVLENTNVDTKPQSDHGSTVQGICSKDTTNSSASKQPLKKERNPLAHFFALKTQGSAPKQEPAARTKKAHKTPSALMTLFGYSLDKGKNQKEGLGTPLAKLSEEASDKDQLDVACSSKPGTSKKDNTSEAVIQTRSLDAGLQDPEENYGICSSNEQRNSSASLDSAKAFGANMLPTKLDPDISVSTEALSGINKPEVPKQSILKMEIVLRNLGKSSPFHDSQNSLAATEQMLQCPVNNLLETNSEMNITSGGDLYDQCLPKLPKLASLDGQNVAPKATNISSSGPSREDESQLLDSGHQVPDMLLFSVGVERSANMQGRDPQSTPSLDTGSMQRKDELCSGLNSSEHIMQNNSSHQFSESGPPTMIKGDNLYNKDSPGSGNSETNWHYDPVSWSHFSAVNSFGLDLHVKQATIDNYPTGRKDFPPLLAYCRHIPELLRDTIQGAAEEKAAVTERPLEHLTLAEENNQT